MEDRFDRIVACDVRETPESLRVPAVKYVTGDVRAPEMAGLFRDFRVDTVVHLATIVTPGRRSDRQFEYSVDVLGTENILDACLEAGVRQIIITSSGAAYGYYPDNPEWIDEQDPIRGNPEFAYSDHKRLVEEMLARYRIEHPELEQLILRPGTILGETADNQITALFQKPFVLGLWGSRTPFVLIWDQDVVKCIIKGILEKGTGIYNLAGDGAVTMKEMAKQLDKPFITLPVFLVQGVLWILKKCGLTQYGPEQVNFLRYRPVLSNRRLKSEFGYIPEKTTQQVFDYYVQALGK
jgi:UDP-glucose 4-epimerase